jgi:ATP-dependent Clp protease protease subunit
MPIGVPRIIYCWGEELPAQWTDIYNFIFRRRMVFLMQYLDDELCNQICGLLINIHMEDRSKELETKEINAPSSSADRKTAGSSTQPISNLKSKSVEDLFKKEDDLAIDENLALEQYTLQAMTREWLNWNTQFFDYSDEPNLFYFAEILSTKIPNEIQQDAQLFSGRSAFNRGFCPQLDIYSPFRLFSDVSLGSPRSDDANKLPSGPSTFLNESPKMNGKKGHNAGQLQLFARQPRELLEKVGGVNATAYARPSAAWREGEKRGNVLKVQHQNLAEEKNLSLLSSFANTELWDEIGQVKNKIETSENALSQRKLIKDYSESKSPSFADTYPSQCPKGAYAKDTFSPSGQITQGRVTLQSSIVQQLLNMDSASLCPNGRTDKNPGISYSGGSANTGHEVLNSLLAEAAPPPAGDSTPENMNLTNSSTNLQEFREYYRKQTEQAFQEFESKKVFMIINSFGGSVGNGITVHDALQFIKAGSLTIALGVAASAASLALAGGTIGERYVTEGCHTMIHQPESSLSGQASDIWIDSLEIMKMRQEVANIYSLSTYRPRHKILRDLDRDFYLTATETIYYGLADEIASNDVIREIIEMTQTVWDYHDTKQQRLLEGLLSP